ncbi:MAG: site-2 protease family protein [Lachnospiraceae bacterium]|nr:site-2 protease family protein [Lachnospiraceae bacterium]
MNIVIAILVFGLLIFIHEFGHFLAARAGKIKVNEFAIGMGPKIASVKSKRETEFSLRALPIGGFCSMLGEDEALDDPDAFNSKNVWTRIMVVVAGPFFNFLLAFVLALILIGAVGYDPAVVNHVEAGMPMAEAGILDGDIITEFRGHTVTFSRELNSDLMVEPLSNQPVEIVIDRDGEKLSFTVTPTLDQGVYRLGFSYYVNERYKTSFSKTILYSFKEVGFQIENVVRSIGMMIRGQVRASDISGPVGIVNIIGETVEETKSEGVGIVLLNIINIAILLSANLGVMNLLPIPALDGGRLLFLIIEVLRGKPIDQEKEGWVHTIGMILLLALMAVIFFNDILRLIRG